MCHMQFKTVDSFLFFIPRRVFRLYYILYLIDLYFLAGEGGGATNSGVTMDLNDTSIRSTNSYLFSSVDAASKVHVSGPFLLYGHIYRRERGGVQDVRLYRYIYTAIFINSVD